MNFAQLVGQTVALLIPKVNPFVVQRVKLVGVDAGGIWIESQAAMNVILRTLNLPSAPRTLAFFLPYHEITFGFVGTEGVSLDEKAFGV